MPKQLNSGRVTQALQRAFGFKGRYTPMLDEVIVPVYVISDPSPAEASRLCSGTVGAIGGGGTPSFPAVQLFNPPDSGVIVNLTTAIATSNTKLELLVNFFDGTLAVFQDTALFRDRRIQGTPAAQMFQEDHDNSGTGTTTAVLQVDGSLSQTASWVASTNDPRQPLMVLAPGTGLVIQSRTDAGGNADEVRANFRWLEIPITEVNPLGGIP